MRNILYLVLIYVVTIPVIKAQSSKEERIQIYYWNKWDGITIDCTFYNDTIEYYKTNAVNIDTTYSPNYITDPFLINQLDSLLNECYKEGLIKSSTFIGGHAERGEAMSIDKILNNSFHYQSLKAYDRFAEYYYEFNDSFHYLRMFLYRLEKADGSK